MLQATSSPNERKPVRTLVVDDSATALRAICSLLRTQDFLEIVGTGTDGESALILNELLQPELVLLDIEMPGLSGIEVARQLRRSSNSLRIIVVSVHDSPEIRSSCAESGASRFVSKVHMSDQLLPVVRQECLSLPGRSV